MTKHWEQLSDLDHLAGGLVDDLGQMWHGFGQFSGSVPLDAVRRVLDLTVEKRPLYYLKSNDEPMLNDDGEIVIAPTVTPAAITKNGDPIYGIFDANSDHCFRVGASEGFLLHPYQELFDLTAEILDTNKDDVEIGCAMSLGHKEQMMVQVRLKEGVTVGGDKLLPWICCYSSVNSTWATGWKPCKTRLQCDNTGALIMREDTANYKIRHTKNSRVKLGEARLALGLMFDSIPKMIAEVDRFQNTALTDNQFRMTLDKLIPLTDKNGNKLEDGRGLTIATSKRATIDRMWRDDPRVSDYNGTVWGAVQAVNTATTHEFTIRGTNNGVTRSDRQVQATVTGSIDKVDQETINAINEVFSSLGMASV